MSWLGIKIRHGNKIGKVIKDSPGVFRILTVQFEDNTSEKIWLATYGPDPKETREFEWFCENPNSSINQTWSRF